MAQHYALTNPDGSLIGFLNDALHTIPAGAVALTEAQWGDWLANPSRRRWTGGKLVPFTPIVPLPVRREAMVKAANERRDAILAAGAPFRGRRVSVDDTGRTDLSGLTLAALLSSTAGAPWPPTYAQGWIALDNSRIPLPAAADGLELGQAVAGWYGAVVQFARDAKDAVLVSTDPEATLAAIAWPDFGATAP